MPGVVKNRPIASRDIEKQRARRKTPLMRAARISALCHPYEYRGSEELSFVSWKKWAEDTRMVHKCEYLDGIKSDY
jgi:hypothetical protein